MKVALSLALAGSVVLVGAGTAHAAEPGAQARAVGRVSIVQAVPDNEVTVTIDGRSVSAAAKVGSVLGPFTLAAGDHDIEFTSSNGDTAVTSTLQVDAGSRNDVVLHRPAAVGGDPVVSSYTTPTSPIGPGKARVLVAHTATVAPADVRVDGKVVFRNIANGEYATADVPSGTHVVALLPTGVKTNPILGPIDVDLKARTVTMVYAVGNPTDSSMAVIAHVVDVKADGSVMPDRIDTGSAGLAAGADVTPFGPEPRHGITSRPSALAGFGAFLLALVGVGALRVVRRRPVPRRG